MRVSKLLKKFRGRLENHGPGELLHMLTRELRGDGVPVVFREAAHSVAALLEGGGSEKGSGSSPTGVTINVTIAVAVGAPGKEPQDDNKDSASASPPTESVVIASAVASSAAPLSRRTEKSADAGLDNRERGDDTEQSDR